MVFGGGGGVLKPVESRSPNIMQKSAVSVIRITTLQVDAEVM